MTAAMPQDLCGVTYAAVTTEVIREYRVTNAPVTIDGNRARFAPEEVTVTLAHGMVTTIMVAGPHVRTGGWRSAVFSGWTPEADQPPWIVALIRAENERARCRHCAVPLPPGQDSPDQNPTDQKG